MSRFLRFAVRVCATTGLLLMLVTFTPVLRWWTQALAGQWGSQDGDVLIVLGGDMTAPGLLGVTSYWRSVYTIFVWRQGHYRQVIISGRETAPAMRDFIVCNGVPRDRVLVEDTADSTRENAQRVAAMLPPGGRYVLLTSDYHMYRASRAFAKTGVAVSPVPFPDAVKRLNSWQNRWTIACILVEETVKTLWYRMHGWI